MYGGDSLIPRNVNVLLGPSGLAFSRLRDIRVSVHVTIEARDSRARLVGTTVVCQIEFLLREWCEQETKPLELLRIQDAFE